MERKTISHKSSSASLHNNPSFSSSLLDSIYRSIDEEKGGVKVPGDMVSYKGLTLITRKNRTGYPFRGDGEEEEEVNLNDFQREKRRSSDKAAFTSRKSSSAVLSSSNSNSSSSSSESCFWSGGLSSSESESFYGSKSKSKSTSSSSSSSCYSMQRPKPIHTEKNSNASSSQKSKKHLDHEEVLAKTKLKALKIYAERKKAKSKQPISPGGRVASFLNSLFANTKKKPKTVSDSEPSAGVCDEGSKVKYSKSRSTPAYCPSSASSYMRSCLTKTLSSSTGGKLFNNGGKRSVRFDPVSVIVDEDSQPCGHKSLQEEDMLKIHVIEENRRVAEAARKLLESYRRTKVSYNDPKGRGDDLSEDEDTNVDDGESCSSSDLFELDNLSAIGIERYKEELPVYETTHVGTNRAIASGLIP